MSDYFPLVPANGPNDVLPYSPNSVYQDLPLSLALAQLGSGGGGSLHASRNVAQLAPYSDDEGEWMNTWTEPAVDYLGFPMDVDTLSRLDHRDSKPSKNGKMLMGGLEWKIYIEGALDFGAYNGDRVEEAVV